MSEDTHLSGIEEELENIEIILRHLSMPDKIACDDGEYVGAFLAQSGLTRLHKIQGLCEKLKPT